MKCELDVRLDRGASYRPGEPIEGTVSVETDGAVRCDNLTVATVFYTHGKGNRHVGVIEEASLFAGDWALGRSEYRFRLRAPDAPLAYHGEILNVDLGVRATADIPWSMDPEKLADIQVTHEPRRRGYEVSWDRKEERAAWGMGCAMMALGLLLVGGVLFAIGALVEEDGFFGFGSAASIMGAIGAIVAIPRWMAERRVGNIRFTLDQAGGAGYREAGEEGFLDVSLSMAASAHPKEVRVTLTGTEVVVKGSGTNKKTYRHALHEREVVLEPSGEPGRYRGRLALPAPGTVPGSFKAPSNEIEWKVAARVDIPGWPDWTDDIPLTVVAV
jgi:hypothetical protein